MRSFLHSIFTQFYLVFLGLLIWRKPTKYAADLQVFSYYSDNQDKTLMKAMVIAALMEMGAAHILFLKLAPQAVQIADALSLATLLMIFGLLVSWRDNPIIIEHNSVKLRWGLFRKYTLSPDQILSVKAGAVDVSRPHPKNHMINAILAEPNVTLSIKPDCVFHNRIQIDHISLVADAPKELEATINGLLEANEAAG